MGKLTLIAGKKLYTYTAKWNLKYNYLLFLYTIIIYNYFIFVIYRILFHILGLGLVLCHVGESLSIY